MQNYKTLEENRRENLCDLGFCKESLDRTTKVSSMKEKLDKLDFIKIKNFYFMNDSVKS